MGEMDPYERIRSIEKDVVTSNWSKVYQGYNGTCSNPEYAPPSSYFPASGSFTTRTEIEMYDIVTPRFKEYQATGKIVNSPMDKVLTSTSISVCTLMQDFRYKVPTNCSGVTKQLWRGSLNQGTNESTGYFEAFQNGGFAATPSIDVQRLIDLSVTGCWAKADQSKAAVLASLGEAKETVTSMCEIIGRLIKIVIAFKKLDFKYLMKQIKPKELEQRYMELRYALRPLYYDCKQMLDAVVAHNKAEDYGRFTFRDKREDFEEETVVRTYTATPSDSGGASIWRTCKGYSSRSVTIRSGLLCSVARPSVLNTWGFDNVAETCWELIPFSFIVDWFFNIGDLIASWTPEAGLAYDASWVTVIDTTLRTRTITASGINPSSSYTYINPRYELGNCRTTELTEHKYRYPDPTRSVLPRFNLNLDTLKLADLLIIAKNIFFRDRGWS